ncbi:MAG: CHAD domain-containing protein [Solirubrobacterales bacterium]
MSKQNRKQQPASANREEQQYFERLPSLMIEALQAVSQNAMRCRTLETSSVHDFRVSIRRALALFDVFTLAYPAFPSPEIRSQLRAWLKQHSALRDVQIQLELIDSQTGGSAALGLLIASLEKSKSKRKSQLRIYWLDNGERLQQDIRRFIAKLSVAHPLKPGRVARPFSTVALQRRTKLILLLAAASETDPLSLHKVRIALKKLRYYLEAYPHFSLFQNELDQLTAYQSALGQVQDYVVLNQTLSRWIAEKEPDNAGLIEMHAICVREQNDLMGAALPLLRHGLALIP